MFKYKKIWFAHCKNSENKMHRNKITYILPLRDKYLQHLYINIKTLKVLLCLCYLLTYFLNFGFPGSSGGKESTCNAGDLGSIPGIGKNPCRRERLPTPVFWPGEFHGLYNPWGLKRVGHNWVTFSHFLNLTANHDIFLNSRQTCKTCYLTAAAKLRFAHYCWAFWL